MESNSMPAAAVAVAAAITADMTPVRAEKKIAKNVKEGQFETPPPVTEKKKSKFFGLAKSTKKTFQKNDLKKDLNSMSLVELSKCSLPASNPTKLSMRQLVRGWF